MAQNALPYDAEVEYLACTGSGEKIDTGIYPTEKTRVVAKALFTTYKSTLFCSRWTSDGNTNTFTFYAASTALAAMADHDGVQHRLLDILDVNITRLNNALDIDFDVSSVKVSLNGTSLCSRALSRGTAYTSSTPIILFTLADVYKEITRIYSCKIYEDSVLVRDMIPVRVGTTGYMYDKVSEQLFDNKGTGSFVLGNDIN